MGTRADQRRCMPVCHDADKGRDKVVELFQERKSQYEELAKHDDEEFRDTVEMAERTGEGRHMTTGLVVKGRMVLLVGQRHRQGCVKEAVGLRESSSRRLLCVSSWVSGQSVSPGWLIGRT